MLKHVLRYFIVIVTLFSLTVVNAQEEEAPETIEVMVSGLYPEGITYDSTIDHFLLGSVYLGSIYTIDLEGNAEIFVEDDDLVSSLGIYADTERERLLVTNSDPGPGINTSPETAGSLAMLGIYSLIDGERIAMVDLGGLLPDQPHVVNDIAVDSDGNIYVTDSFSPVIYRVDTEHNATIFLQNDAFVNEGFNLNGIVYVPDGYLIVAQYSTGSLYKVPIDDPESFQEIALETPVISVDGLVLLDETHLMVITNALGTGDPTFNLVTTLQSEDGWETAEQVDQFSIEGPATTGTLRDGVPYILFGSLNILFDPTNTIVADNFTIQMVEQDMD